MDSDSWWNHKCFICLYTRFWSHWLRANVTQYYILGECFYLAAMAMTKVTFCLLFLRVFREKPFIYYVWGTLGLSAAYGVSFVVATIFQCWPISYGWNQWDGLHTGTCNNINLQGWLSSILNIVLDIIVIGLPLNKLSKLVMSPTKKITIMFMFCKFESASQCLDFC